MHCTIRTKKLNETYKEGMYEEIYQIHTNERNGRKTYKEYMERYKKRHIENRQLDKRTYINIHGGRYMDRYT